jgi:hypothetical protein
MAKAKKPNASEGPLEQLGLLIGGKELKKDEGEGLDGEGNYQVVNPYRLYLGKSYSDWATDWFNWFLSADADKLNLGPVVFLRSRGLPNSITGANISDVPDSDSANMDGYRPIYINDPNIRIGGDRLQIFDDQAVFVPIIVGYAITTPDRLYMDWGRMQDYTGLTIDYGDNPPETNQLTINNEDIVIPKGLESIVDVPEGLELKPFRITTPVFPAVVPETQYGRSVKDFLEHSPLAPGSYPAQVDGYFVILKFAPGTYWVHSWASAGRERMGSYFSELLYQIEVVRRRRKDSPHKGLITDGLRADRDPHEGFTFGSEDHKTIVRPSRNETVFSRTLYEKSKTGELTEPEIRRFHKFFSSSLPSPPRKRNGKK